MIDVYLLAAAATILTAFGSAIWVVATVKAEGKSMRGEFHELRAFVGEVNKRSIDSAGWIERIRGVLRLNGSMP